MFGIAFDVDGVLYLGSTAHPVPGAVDVLTRVLQDHVPHVFVTNSTGTTEEEKASELTSMLPASSGLAIDPRAVIVATTPMRALAPSLKGKRILAVARTAAFPVQLLESYGFEREMIVPVQAYAARHPTLFPQKKYLDSSSSTSFDPSQDRIDAVFLLQTPEDWGEALQVCLDVLRSSDGVPGGSDCDLSRTQAVKVYSGNPDFDYRALHSVPRLTLGAFRKALEAFYVESTGFPLQYELYGKPFAPVYDLATKELERQSNGTPLSAIYAIGDNPVSDIAGARAAGRPWHSILVKTGVFTGTDNDATHPADIVLPSVTEAWSHINASKSTR